MSRFSLRRVIKPLVVLSAVAMLLSGCHYYHGRQYGPGYGGQGYGHGGHGGHGHNRPHPYY